MGPRHRRGPSAPAALLDAPLEPGHATLVVKVTALKARVRAGRLILDEPTTLPEGSELSLIVAPVEEEFDDLDREEIDRLLEEAEADRRAGRSFPAEDVLRELEASERASPS